MRCRLHDPAPDVPAFVRQGLAEKGREMVLVVADRHGAVWLHRKSHWRLPSGNLRPGEDPIGGARREVEEEFGAPLPLVRLLHVLELETGLPDAPEGARPFVAHLFLFDGGGRVQGPVPAEGIDGWRALELEVAADLLRAAGGAGVR